MKKARALHNPNSWWDDRCRILSSFLWLPTVQTLRDMNQSYANIEHSDAIRNAWFNSEVYSLPYGSKQESSAQSPEGRTTLRSRKIRVYPDAGQRQLLAQWFSAARYIHNKTLEYISEGNNPDWLGAKRFIMKRLPDWTNDVPYQIKALAVRDACVSWKVSAKNGGHAGFKTREDEKQSIFIPKTSITRNGIYPRFLGDMEHSEKIPAPEGDCRFTREYDRYFVCVPVKVCALPETQGRTVSLDPGIRTFMTFYSLDSCGKIGKGAFGRIYSLCRYLDGLNEQMPEMSHHRRYKTHKAANRLRWKMMNLIEDMQHKTALFLVKNFDVIALPEYREDFTDGISSSSVKDMITFAHRGFQDFLRAKAGEYGKSIITQDEAGTSAVCSWNGKAAVSGRVIQDGSILVDRDYNGARGIFLRAMRESAIRSPV